MDCTVYHSHDPGTIIQSLGLSINARRWFLLFSIAGAFSGAIYV
jgi:hypothetical protein